MSNKNAIITLFNENIKGKTPDTSSQNARHDGKEGHWLEQQFGIKANANTSPDIYGYELKNQTTSGKTTFGDWSANEYIFMGEEFGHLFAGCKKKDKQNSFLSIFGKSNPKKDGRFSWSGSPCPKINCYNDYGQKLEVTDNNDIIAIYSYSKDQQPNKSSIIPIELQSDNIILARWFGESLPDHVTKGKSLKTKLEDKFNDKGWFTCKKNSKGEYEKICFGKPINFDSWIELVRDGIVYFDSGMYEGNPRPYSQWRANNTFWDSLIIEEDI